MYDLSNQLTLEAAYNILLELGFDLELMECGDGVKAQSPDGWDFAINSKTYGLEGHKGPFATEKESFTPHLTLREIVRLVLEYYEDKG